MGTPKLINEEFLYQDHTYPEELTGLTIRSSEVISAEYGRTYDNYLLLTFTDGSRQLLGMSPYFCIWRPKPPLEQVRRASSFFTPKDVEMRERDEEAAKQDALAAQRSSKMRIYEQLRKELGLD